MKILIADDEKLVRFSLKSMLEEIGIPASSIHVAVDGEELMEKARRVRPDVALVDIRMPKLNGLEAIERISALAPDTRWVVLTSYSSFDYARKAIGLGASEYLLKPVSPRELAEVIERLGRQRQEEHLHANEEFEAQANALLHNTLTLQADSQGFLVTASFLPVQLEFDSVLPDERLQEGKLQACQVVRAKLSAAAGSGARLALCILPDGTLVALGAWQAGGEEGHACAGIVRVSLRKAQGLVQQALHPQIAVTCLHGEECASFELLRGQLRELGALAALRPVLGVGRSIALAELRQRAAEGSARRLGAVLLELAASYRQGNLLVFLRQLDALREALQARPPQRGGETERAALRRFLRCALGFSPATTVSNEAWLGELAEWGRRELARRPGAEGQDPVARTLEYLRNSYARSVGLAEIARRLSLTPNYLSSLFHRKTGMTFQHYLTRLRLERAGALLARRGVQVQEVAREVGYSGSRHFSRLFRRQFGCRPSQYLSKGAPGTGEA
jgi:two-component system response regulator YesN